MPGDERSAAATAFTEAVAESGVTRFLPPDALSRLRNSLLARVTTALPRLLTSSRTLCPQCGDALYESHPGRPRDPRASCWIFGEPSAFELVHVPRWCKRCVVTVRVGTALGDSHSVNRVVRYWCGFLEEPVPGTLREYKRRLDAGYMHNDYFLLVKSFGVTLSWLRRWRYRQFLHRSSFQGEAMVFRLMHGTSVPQSLRSNLSGSWVRHVLWKRAQDAEAPQVQDLREKLLTAPVEDLIASSWHWYEPMMASRRHEQFRLSGDRADILAMDGNAKLHRRTCGMPFSEVVDQPLLGKRLLRGCSCRPCGKGTMCRKHALALGKASVAPGVRVKKHRLKRALRSKGDVAHLEVQLEGHSARWQPACTVDEAQLAGYFATRADARIQARRARRFLLRSQGARGKRGRKETSFMATWSSLGPRAASSCATHKETEAHVVSAARSAGFLTAVSSSGIVVDVGELIGAESLSQRFCLLGKPAARLPSLAVIVHDDACHLQLFAQANGQGSPPW